jgi:hypothetical protein
VDIERWLGELEDNNLQLQSGLHQLIAESICLWNVVNTLMGHLAVAEHGRGNLIIIEDSSEPVRRLLLPEGHLHWLVLIEDLVGSLSGLESGRLESIC